MSIYDLFKNLSINLKIGILVVYFLITISGMLATVYYFHVQGAQEAARVDVAGAQRMLSQRMTKQALGIALGRDELRADLKESIQEYDSALTAMEHGGPARGYILPPAPEESIHVIAGAKELWRDFKPRIETIASESSDNSDFAQALDYVLKNEGALLSRSDNVVVVLTELSDGRFALMQRILLAFFSLAFVVALLAYLPYKREVVEPIVTLAERARRIGRGDLKSTVAGAERADEIGALAKSLENTVKELDDLHSNLAQKIEERTLKLQEANISLREQAKELRRTNELKELFADILRHDLVNHISIIKGVLDLWGESAANSEELRMLRENTRKVDELIKNATILSKMEGTDSLKYSEMDVGKCIRDAGENLKGLAKKKNIDVVWDFEDFHGIPCHSSIEHVFTNLISNAIKYSPENSKVTVSMVDSGESIRIAVKDQGPGVPDAYKKSVFERFSRRAREGVVGTGLGLAIAKRVVELHKGRIWVEDNPKGGSIFYVELPKSQPPSGQ